MLRNTDGLKRSGQTRSDTTRQRAMTAIREMQREEQPINFRAVAARALVSAAWLYGNKPVRDSIVKLRQTAARATPESAPSRQQLSHERIVATLRFRIRTLEEANRELKKRLEAAYGLLAVAPDCSNPRTSLT